MTTPNLQELEAQVAATVSEEAMAIDALRKHHVLIVVPTGAVVVIGNLASQMLTVPAPAAGAVLMTGCPVVQLLTVPSSPAGVVAVHGYVPIVRVA